jgi:hypothetical protein
MRVLDDDLDRRHPIRCAPSSRATAACYSDKLGAQGRVNALCEARAYGAAAALAGSDAGACVMVDGKTHATGDQSTIAVRPRPSVTLLEDHVMSKPRMGRRRNSKPYAHVYVADMSCR